MIFPVTVLRAAARAAEEVLQVLRDRGTQVPVLDRLQTREELYSLIGYHLYERFDREIAMKAGTKGAS